MTDYEKIDQMSQYEIAYQIRYAISGHKYFDCTYPYYEYLMKRFKELGGMTPEISKQLGWK